jgi:hypothetical protein
MAKKTQEKMLTIPSHKGNSNQNHIKIPPVRIASIKNTTTNVGEDAWEKGTLIHC